MVNNKISVVLADDHPMVLKGIKASIEESGEIEVVGVLSDGESLITFFAENPCDVVVLDINLPGANGIETAEALRRDHPEAKILIFTMHHNVEYVRRAVAVGATGFVLKDGPPSELIVAIQSVTQGGSFFSPKVAQSLASGKLSSYDIGLTERELEVLQAVASGKSSKTIAWDIGISVRTVETHRRNLKQKFGAKSTAECISRAYTAGIIVAP